MNNDMTRRQFIVALPGAYLCLRAMVLAPAGPETSEWAEVERLCAGLVTARRMPGVALAVSRDGSVVFAGEWGFADLERGEPIRPQTRFQIASVTKTYIGALCLLLARDGTLALDEPASRLLPEFPRSTEFTIRMLLNHTAGLGEYTQRPLEELARDASRDYSNEALVTYMTEVRPLFVAEPGSDWAYSNTGYVLLGVAMERAADAPLAELLDRHLVEPTRLRETAWNGDHDAEIQYATGYGFQGGGLFRRGNWIRAPFVSSSYIGASGAIRSTARDVCAWFDTLFGGGFLTPGELEEMLVPAPIAGQRAFVTPGGSSYGLGVWTGRTERGRVLWHTGSTAGFAADARHYPDLGVSIAMLGNADARRVGSVPRRIREAVLDALAAA